MESLQYFLIVYQCLEPPQSVYQCFGTNRMSTKSRIESTGQSLAGSAKKKFFFFSNANNQPVKVTYGIKIEINCP